MPPDSMGILTAAKPAALLILAALLTLGCEAMVNLNDQKLKKEAEESRAATAVQRLLAHPARLRLSVELARWCLALAAALPVYGSAGAGLARYFAGLGLGMGVALPLGLLLAVVGTALVILTLCRVVPARLAAHFPQQMAYGLLPLVQLAYWLFSPLARLAEGCAALLVRLAGANPDQPQANVTEEEIRLLIDAGQEDGTIGASERHMINNIFEFDDRTVEEVMTHRTDLTAVEIESGIQRVMEVVLKAGHSRIPVYQEDLDSIEGVLYVKDLLPLIMQGVEQFSLREIMRTPLYVPETTRCRDLFTQFTTQKLHLAVVVDEYGGTSGIVTMEDLVESIFGNIQDEYDNEEEESSRIGENAYTLDASLYLDDVEQLLDIELPDETECETIGGLLVEALDYIPGPGQHPTVQLSGVDFTVLEADERRIIKIRAERAQPEEEL